MNYKPYELYNADYNRFWRGLTTSLLYTLYMAICHHSAIIIGVDVRYRPIIKYLDFHESVAVSFRFTLISKFRVMFFVQYFLMDFVFFCYTFFLSIFIFCVVSSFLYLSLSCSFLLCFYLCPLFVRLISPCAESPGRVTGIIASYTGNPGVKSRLGYRLPWSAVFVIFLRFVMRMSRRTQIIPQHLSSASPSVYWSLRITSFNSVQRELLETLLSQLQIVKWWFC